MQQFKGRRQALAAVVGPVVAEPLSDRSSKSSSDVFPGSLAFFGQSQNDQGRPKP